MKITRRDFLKTTALTSLYFAGFGGQTYANTAKKKKGCREGQCLYFSPMRLYDLSEECCGAIRTWCS